MMRLLAVAIGLVLGALLGAGAGGRDVGVERVRLSDAVARAAPDSPAERRPRARPVRLGAEKGL